MDLATRLILALALLLQPLQGLTVQRCVGMPIPVADAAVELDCSCCLGSDPQAGSEECPFAAQQYAGCNCKEAQRDKPVPPPGERRAEHVYQVLTFVPATAGAILPEPVVLGPAPSALPQAARLSGHTLHQLHCTWLM